METNSREQLKTHPSTLKPSISESSVINMSTISPSVGHSRTNRVKSFLKNNSQYLKGVLIRVSVLIAVLAVLIGVSLGVIYSDNLPRSEDFSHLEFDWKITPQNYLTPYNTSQTYNVLLDGHAHSTYSDGKMNVRQLLNWHLANGYNAVIVSDHNSILGGLMAEKIALEEYNQSIVVIPAMEYTCCRIHMNFIDINTTFVPVSPSPTNEELQQVINEVHALGGVVIVNHIPWSNTTENGYQLPRLPNHPSVQQLIEWGVDGFEIVHDSVFDLNTFQITSRLDLIQMAGTDIHHPTAPATTWLTLQSTNMTKEAIMHEIRNRRTSFLIDPAGTRPRIYVDSPASFNMLMPLLNMGYYFTMFYSDTKGMYDFQGSFCHPEMFRIHGDIIGWFIFWIVIFFLSFEFVRLSFILITRKIKDYRSRSIVQ